MENLLLDRYQRLQVEIQLACQRAQRNAKDIDLLLASKYATAEQMNTLIASGITLIGENRLQDAQKKFPSLLPVRKHFIGHLQLNKVKKTVQMFEMIESLDSLELATAIHKEAEKLGKKMPVLIQVNAGQEDQKFGLRPSEVLPFFEKLLAHRYLSIEGLMAVLPYFEDAEKSRPYFRTMRTLFDFCRKKYKRIATLSMGMSHDFTVAIEEGATEIRVGSYFFE